MDPLLTIITMSKWVIMGFIITHYSEPQSTESHSA